MATHAAVAEPEATENQIVDVLRQHYRNGMVSLPANSRRPMFFLARQRGYISDEGYLTRKGRVLLANYSWHTQG